MSHKILEGKKGIIFGALDNQSIAWKTAESISDAGGSFVLTNAPVALRMGTINVLAEKTGSQVIPADATNIEDLNQLIDKAQDILGSKLDFVLHSILNWVLRIDCRIALISEKFVSLCAIITARLIDSRIGFPFVNTTPVSNNFCGYVS